jgi:putative Mn2+ efflux pump MntP
MDSIGSPYLVIIALALAMDAFSVAWGIGFALRTLTLKQVARMSSYFGFFQFMMLVLGRLAGTAVETMLADFDHWIAFGFLTLIGSRMIYESFKPDKRQFITDPKKGVYLLTLSVATSIDALMVGFSLTLVNEGILYSALIVGLTAAMLIVAGTLAGTHSRRLIGERAEMVGGIVLLLIGLRILIAHILKT